ASPAECAAAWSSPLFYFRTGACECRPGYWIHDFVFRNRNLSERQRFNRHRSHGACGPNPHRNGLPVSRSGSSSGETKRACLCGGHGAIHRDDAGYFHRTTGVGDVFQFHAAFLAGGSLTPREIYQLVAPDLVRVEDELKSYTHASIEPIAEIGEHLLNAGGKRIRPVLLLLTARMLGGVSPSIIRLAAVVELIHNATLVHDDIIDRADTRRGRPTVNA